jgi:hypothetical protein
LLAENPVRLAYTYYHCSKSSNPSCVERGIERRELELQLLRCLECVRLPDFHDHWINSCFVMLQEKSDASGALPIIVQSFPGSTPAVQREIIMSVFRTLVLKDRKLATSLKTPFSFLGETEAVSSLEQESFNQQALQEQMA